MWFSVCYKCRLRWFNVYWLNRNICQNVLDITASEYSCLLERCFAPTGKWYIDIPKKKIILLLAKNTENRFPCGPQTVTKLCCKAQCSLFITFIHCSHNSTVYGVSTQHKHHSTYPSMCHCYEPGHFATFTTRFNFNTTSTHNTASHKPSGLTKRSPLCWCTDTFLCVFPITKLHFCVWRRKESPVDIFLFITM